MTENEEKKKTKQPNEQKKPQLVAPQCGDGSVCGDGSMSGPAPKEEAQNGN